MNRMPAGQYIPGNSVLYRLDARVKLVGLFLLLAAVISASDILGYLFILGVAAVVTGLSGVPVRSALGPIRRLWLFFLVILAMNALFFDSADPLWTWGILRVSAEGARQGAKVVFNVALIMVPANILMCTTAPMETTSAVTSLLKPLKLIGIPTEDVAMIVGAAIQFIPTLMEEADTIKKAQTARGARFESRRLAEKAASFLPLILPIFLAAFRRADELATAMEARGYRNARSRTKKRSAPLRCADIAALAACTAVCLVQFFVFGD